jgi:ribosomal protein L11 methyltransferase
VKWVRITVRTTPEAADGVLEVMSRLAGGAVQAGSGERPALQCYVPAAGAGALATKIRARLEALHEAGISTRSRVTSSPAAARDWERYWRRDFRPQRIAPGLLVIPPWERHRARAGETVVVIQPAMAFGTGQHPTTRMCLQALLRHAVAGGVIADVGCGSGILAIAALKMGARLAVAIDNDPVAVKAAAGNARRNRVDKRILIRTGDLLRGVRRRFHTIAANLTAEQLVQLAGDASARLRPGGVFIGSGIAKGKAAAVRRALREAGLAPLESHRMADWRTVVFRTGDS